MNAKEAAKHTEWVGSRVALTPLEIEIYTLDKLIESHKDQNFRYEGPSLKTHEYYMTIDGYGTGSIVWCIRAFIPIQGDIPCFKQNIFGRDVVHCVQNTITFFDKFLELPWKGFQEWRRDFTQEQRECSDEWARCIHGNR